MLLNNNRVTLNNGWVRVLEVNVIRLGAILNTIEPCLSISMSSNSSWFVAIPMKEEAYFQIDASYLKRFAITLK